MEGKVIVVTSGKGGVGKTTVTASIGAALALQGKRVAVVDMDIGLRNLDVVMGLENRIVFNVVDVVQKKCKLKQAAIKDRRIDNLFLIPASQSDDKSIIKPENMVWLCNKLRREYDFALLDCPAGIEQGFKNAIEAADEALVVCTPEVSSVRDADRVIGLLYAHSITPKLIVNRIVPKLVEKGDMLSHVDVVDVLSIDLVGLVEMDDAVVVSSNTGNPIVQQKDSRAGKAFNRIAMRLDGHPDLPVEDPMAHDSFWRKIGKKLGRKKQE
ncbi:MAG: septum site-determining protein MinD [Desulfosalsimonas sp.]